jgi:putative endonuclease
MSTETKGSKTANTTNIRDYYIYIILCTDNTYYTGITTNLKRRFAQHLNGSGAKYTRAHKPEKIVFSFNTGPKRGIAQRIEYYIKKLPRNKKQELIADPHLLEEYIANA